MDVLLLNAIAYVGLFIYTLYKFKRINIYNSVILAFTIVAVLGYITTKMGIQLVGFENFGERVSIVPYICLFISVLLICTPLKKLESIEINENLMFSSSLNKLMQFSVCVLFIVVAVKLYEFKLVMDQGIAEAYMSQHSEGTKLIEFSNPILSFIATKGMTYTDAIFPVMVYFYFCKLKFQIGSNMRTISTLILCFAPEVLESLCTGSKGMLLFNAFDMIFFFLYFERHVSSSIKKICIAIGAIAASILIFYTILIQNERNDFDKTDKLASEVILRYLGEGMPNMGDSYETIRMHPMGKRFFPVFTGGKQFKSAEDMADYWGVKTNARVLNFKTIWGDAFVEFGIIGSFIFLLMVVYLYRKYVFLHYNEFYMIPLIYYYYHKVCIYGIFNVCFVDMRSLQITLYAIILCIYLKKITKSVTYEQ